MNMQNEKATRDAQLQYATISYIANAMDDIHPISVS